MPRIAEAMENGRELDAPAKTPETELVDAKAAFELVLDRAGCWPRDRTTKRTVDEVKTKTGKWGRNAPPEPTDGWFLDGLTPTKAPADSDGDGMPDAWEQSHNLDLNDPDDATRIVAVVESLNDQRRGYSHIEFYINDVADNLVP